ncbi:hypothetical protein [Aquabacterium sp.]|uniref:hypothetical protein n=1 Tax=Aquabacterium sp. TaxID=1872578 RepID=UPI001988839D|nr:hypothetical protein [Aquabacterium sp.]MBC7698973.1 hypothetical protein [Aquabacterium sp.]
MAAPFHGTAYAHLSRPVSLNFVIKGFGQVLARYLQDKESERLRQIRLAAILILALNCVLLLADWYMVPDQFQVALGLRLLVQAPLTIVGLLCLKGAHRSVRELLALVLGLVTAGITCYVSVTSQDPLAPDYLVALFMILLFSSYRSEHEERANWLISQHQQL